MRVNVYKIRKRKPPIEDTEQIARDHYARSVIWHETIANCQGRDKAIRTIKKLFWATVIYGFMVWGVWYIVGSPAI